MARSLEEIFGTSVQRPTSSSATTQQSSGGKRSLEEIFGTSVQQAQPGSTPSSQTTEGILETDPTKLAEQGRFGGEGLAEQSTPSPLNPLQRAELSIFRTPEYKMKQLQDMGFKDISSTPDGRLLIAGRPVDPTPNGFVSFLQDSLGDLGDMVGPAIPFAGQVGADLGMMASAPATGGASLLGLAGANAAGAAGGEAARQALAYQIGGEPFSAGDIGMQAALAGAAVPVGKMLQPVAKAAMRPFASAIGGIAKKMGDAFPSVAEAVLKIGVKDSENLLHQMRGGRLAADLLNPKTAASERLPQIWNKTFLGGEMAEASSINMVKQFQANLKGAAADPTHQGWIRSMYKDVFGLSDNAISQMENYGADELMDQKLIQPETWKELAGVVKNSFGKARVGMQEQYASALESAITNAGDREVSVSPLTKQLFNNLRGLRIMVGDELNKDLAGGKDIQRIYVELARRFGLVKVTKAQKMVRGEVSSREWDLIQELAKKGIKDPTKVRELVANELSREGTTIMPGVKSMTLAESKDMLLDLDPLLDKAFKELPPNYSRPLAEFLDGLRTQMSSVKGAEGLKAANAKYARFKEVSKFFDNLRSEDTDAVQGVINKLRGTMKGSEQTVNQSIRESFLGELDEFLPDKVVPRLKLIAAAEELNGKNMAETSSKFFKVVRQLHKETPDADVITQRLLLYDEALRPGFKLTQPIKDHLTAAAYSSNQQNFFRARALSGMLGVGLGLGFGFAGHPILGTAILGGALALGSPSGLGRAVRGGSAAMAGMRAGTQAVGKTVGGAVSQPQMQAALRALATQSMAARKKEKSNKRR